MAMAHFRFLARLRRAVHALATPVRVDAYNDNVLISIYIMHLKIMIISSLTDPFPGSLATRLI